MLLQSRRCSAGWIFCFPSFRTTYLSCCTPPALLNHCSFSYLQLHRLDLNAMVVGWDEEIKIYIFIFAWKCGSKLTTAPLLTPFFFLIFVIWLLYLLNIWPLCSVRPFKPYIHVSGEGICRDEHIVGAICKSSETLVELNSSESDKNAF